MLIVRISDINKPLTLAHTLKYVVCWKLVLNIHPHPPFQQNY